MIYDNYAHASIEIISWKSFLIFQILSVMVGKSLVAKNHIYLGKIVGFVGFNFILMTFQLITQWFFYGYFFPFCEKYFQNKILLQILWFFQKFAISAYTMKRWLIFHTSYFEYLQTWLNIFITPCHFRNITKLKKNTLLPTLEIYHEYYDLKCICKFTSTFICKFPSCKFHKPSFSCSP